MEATLSKNAIAVHGLSVRRGSFALQDLTVALPAGFVTGLVGPNGAGKTTLIKAILGLVAPQAGDVRMTGDERAGSRAARERIGIVLDRITAAPEWRVASIGRRIGPMYACWDERFFQELLRRFAVPGTGRVSELSRGQTVKLSLAMALAHHPELLVLDEPSSGLDPVARRDLADVIHEFMLDPRHTVLFSTHVTSELDDLADFVIVLAGGQAAYTGMLDDLHERFAVVRGRLPFPEAARTGVINLRLDSGGGFEAFIRSEDTVWFGSDIVIDAATTDDAVVHFAEAASARSSGAGTGTSFSAPQSEARS